MTPWYSKRIEAVKFAFPYLEILTSANVGDLSLNRVFVLSKKKPEILKLTCFVGATDPKDLDETDRIFSNKNSSF